MSIKRDKRGKCVVCKRFVCKVFHGDKPLELQKQDSILSLDSNPDTYVEYDKDYERTNKKRKGTGLDF